MNPFICAINVVDGGPTEEKNPSGKNSDVTSVNIDIVFACRSISSIASFSASFAVLLSTNFFTWGRYLLAFPTHKRRGMEESTESCNF